jgi:hypothetical protein
MGIINITRGAEAPSMVRSDVKPGQVFATKKRDGKLGTLYAHIGTNGRMYSVKVLSGELASSSDPRSKVTLAGTFKYVLSKKAAPGVVRECRRSEVKSGEFFSPMGSDLTYLHIGAVSLARNGFLSVPLHNTENHSIGKNPNGRVRVLGTFTLDTSLTK